jgi:hypothetical protein
MPRVTNPEDARLCRQHFAIHQEAEASRGIGKREETEMKKARVVLLAVAGVAGLVAVASAHMWGGGYGTNGYGWMGMGPGWMHGSGYYCNGYGGTDSAALKTQAEVQKSVETFAGKSFPGYKVGTAERDSYGRPFYTAPLTGKDTRFEVQVNGFDGTIVAIYPEYR